MTQFNSSNHSSDAGNRDDSVSATSGLEDLPRMSLGDHLEDLRKRLILAILGLSVAVGLSLLAGRTVISWIEYPYQQAMLHMGKPIDLKVLEVTGAFTMYLKVSFYAGLVMASPWVFYQLWQFVAAGLFRRERKYVYMAIPFSVLLFLGWAAFAVLLSIPAIEFFIRFGDSLHLEPIITLYEYVSFMMNLLLAFGIVFQMPLVVLVLAKVGLVNMGTLRRYRRHVLVGISIVAAILAPPDILSMIAMALPMWLLYELGVLMSWLLIFRKRPAENSAV